MFHRPIYIAGQTGSGKTGVSIELAKRLGNAEIVNADAFQCYQGIEILAATPDRNERRDVPHHLFGIYPVDRECDVAQFADLARGTINQLSGNSVPIIVGGSGLYLKAITHGLAPTPPGDETLRAELEKQSLEELVESFRKLDPEGAEKTNLTNRRYVTRNLEICLLSGQPASVLKANWENNAPSFTGIYLQRARDDIYDRINRRTFQMFEDGAVDEVKSLPGELSSTASKAIGLREIKQFLDGGISETECIETIQQITRRYAKRQETWFKKERQFMPVACEVDDTTEEIVDRILKIFTITELQSRTENKPCPISKTEIQTESN